MMKHPYVSTILITLLLILSVTPYVYAADIQPDLIKIPIPISGILNPYQAHGYGVGYTDAVSIYFSSVTNNRILSVTIKVNGVVVWSGGMTTGDAVTVDTGGDTVVIITNWNNETVQYKGTITVYLY